MKHVAAIFQNESIKPAIFSEIFQALRQNPTLGTNVAEDIHHHHKQGHL